MKYRFKKHPSKLATLMVTFGAGSRVEHNTEYPPGIAHFMEHMRFKGTKTRSANDLSRDAGDGGGSWNAWTSRDNVSYYMSIPEENIEVAFDCLSDIIKNPVFPEDEMLKEQGVVCQEIRMRNDNIDTLVDQRLMNIVFDNSLTSPICGTEESVRSVTRDDLMKFNKEFYSSEHMLITLGASENYEYLVEKYFGTPDDVLLFSGPDKNVSYAPSAEDRVFKEGQLQDSISICFGGQNVNELSAKSRAATKVFTSIFGSGMTSRLWLKIREDLGLVYGVGSYLSHQMDGSVYEIYASTEPKNSKTLIEAVDGEIDKFLKDGATEEELSRVKNVIKSGFYGAMDTSFGALASVLPEEFFGFTSSEELIKEIEQVTLNDVHEVAEKIFSGTKYTVIGTGNAI